MLTGPSRRQTFLVSVDGTSGASCISWDVNGADAVVRAMMAHYRIFGGLPAIAKIHGDQKLRKDRGFLSVITDHGLRIFFERSAASVLAAAITGRLKGSPAASVPAARAAIEAWMVPVPSGVPRGRFRAFVPDGVAYRSVVLVVRFREQTGVHFGGRWYELLEEDLGSIANVDAYPRRVVIRVRGNEHRFLGRLQGSETAIRDPVSDLERLRSAGRTSMHRSRAPKSV
jgi:hypothetical protein